MNFRKKNVWAHDTEKQNDARIMYFHTPDTYSRHIYKYYMYLVSLPIMTRKMQSLDCILITIIHTGVKCKGVCT